MRKLESGHVQYQAYLERNIQKVNEFVFGTHDPLQIINKIYHLFEDFFKNIGPSEILRLPPITFYPL